MTDVLSKNLFDLLGDDGEEGVPQKAPQAAAPVKKEQKQAAAPVPQKRDDNRRQGAPRNEYPRRGGAVARGDAEGRVNRGPRETGDFERAPREGQREGGERGAFRGARGARGGQRGGRGREFDRRSGTGRRDTEKKEVAGKGSWGDPITSQEEGSKAAEQEVAVADGTEPTAEEKPAEAAAEEPKEPEETFKTLDQYLAERNAKKTDVQVRKANEGADDSQWKDAVVLQKEEEEYFMGGKQSKGKRGVATPKEKASKVFAAIEQRFADEPKRGGRGGRGRGGSDRPQSDRPDRPNRGRGGRSGNVVNVEDEKAFPTLGSK